MDKLRKLGLRISFATVTLGVILWCVGFFSNNNSEDFKALGIYLVVASVFFASPHMIITHQKNTIKTKLETLADLAVSGFYSVALVFVLYNAIPYFNSSQSISTLQIIGQSILAISFLWTLCLHCWSTFVSLAGALKPTQS